MHPDWEIDYAAGARDYRPRHDRRVRRGGGNPDCARGRRAGRAARSYKRDLFRWNRRALMASVLGWITVRRGSCR